jgi:fucose 4-O-acetylase-like acetyltransferase
VVFIHNNPTELNFAGGTEIYAIPIYVNIIRQVISNIIARIAVPLFFLISGFLLYVKETKFFTVLRKRSRTILLPYILWNVLGIIFYYVVQSFPFTKQYFTTAWVRDFNVLDWIGAFTGKSGLFKSPIIFQFWFLRDLFILDLLFLLIKKLVDRFPVGIIILFFIFWVNDIKIYALVALRTH